MSLPYMVKAGLIALPIFLFANFMKTQVLSISMIRDVIIISFHVIIAGKQWWWIG